MNKSRISFTGSQTLLASANEFNSMGNFNSTETVGDARRLRRYRLDFKRLGVKRETIKVS